MVTLQQSEILEQLKVKLLADTRRISELVLAAHSQELPDLPTDEDLRIALRDAVYADVDDALTGFRFDQPLPRALTYESSHLARVAARSRLPLPSLLRLFRIGQRTVWKEASRALNAVEPDTAKREGMLEQITELIFQGGDRLSTLQTEEYLAERDRILRSREQKRLAAVHDILQGGDPDPAILDYDLKGDHVAVVASGTDAEAILRAAARETGSVALIIQAAPDQIWAWFRSPPQPRQLDSSARLRIGIGSPGTGPRGFAISLEEARAAHATDNPAGTPITHFDDISLIWLLTRDTPAAMRFVERELGPVLRKEDGGRRLIDTLEAYLEAGHNAASTAARLDINVRTASNRIRSIEDLLGHTVTSRNAQLHAAVILHRSLHHWMRARG